MVWMYHPHYEPVNVPDPRHEVRGTDGEVVMIITTSLMGEDGVPFAVVSDDDGERLLAEWKAGERARVQAEIDTQYAAVLASYNERVERYKRIGWTDDDIVNEIGPLPEKMEYML